MNTEKSTAPRPRRAAPPRSRRPWGRWLGLLAGVLLAVVAAALLAFRYFGLPTQISQRLDAELARQGLSVTYDKLYLDPFGRAVARDLRLRYEQEGAAQSVRIERLLFSFNWISWWRGEPFLGHASIVNADLTLPLDGETEVLLRNVQAQISFRPSALVVHELRADCLNLEVSLRGTVDFSAYTPGAAPDGENRRARAAAWRRIQAVLADCQSARPVRVAVEGDVRLARPEESRLHLQLTAARQAWRNVLAERVTLDARYEDQIARLELDIDFLRGGFHAEANWTHGARKARGQFSSDVDLTLLAPALPPRFREFFRGVRFRRLPQNEGVVEVDWSEGLRGHLQARAEWEDFTIRDAYFDRLYLPFSTDGKRMMVSGLTLRGRGGEGEMQVFYDGAEVLRASVNSSLDPTIFAPLFGPGAQPFFNSLKFRAGGPRLQARVEGRGMDPASMKATGTVQAADFTYKGVELSEIRTTFHYAGRELHLPDLFVRRKEGEGTGEIRHNFETRIVRLKGVKARLNIPEVARIISSKMEEYVRPYRFLGTPAAEAEGVVDVDNQKLTDLKVHVVAPEGMDYKFLGKDIRLTALDADLAFKGSKLAVVPRKPFGLFGGKASAQLNLDLIDNPPYAAKISMQDADFGQLMRTYFGNNDVSGTLGADASLTGRLDDLRSIDGFGTLAITKGVLYDIPIFGGFSQVLNSIVPNLGYAVADKARAEYRLDKGLVHIDKLDVYSAAFALIGNGSYDYVDDKVDLNMRVNARGILGTALFPFSKLFEYEGKGSMHDTKWAPKVF